MEHNTCNYKIHIPAKEGYPDVTGRYYKCTCGVNYINIENAQEWIYCPCCGAEIVGRETYSCSTCKFAEPDGESYYCENPNGIYACDNVDDATFDGCVYYAEHEEERQ